jgi:ubiquinone/menaquinone biosynthesis C-methylase UbiE
LVGDDYFVLVGHTKTQLDAKAIGAGLARLRAQPRLKFVTLSEMGERARGELTHTTSASAVEEASRQVERERVAALGDERNLAQSRVLQEMIPLDRRRILDVGCGDGFWSARIAASMPWGDVVGLDAGEEFIAKANRRFSSDRVSFVVGDFARMDFPDAAFDCVYADNSLEHAYDVQGTLAELHRVLSDGGALLAAVPPDAHRPSRVCDNHTWKTAPADARLRLEETGFVDVTIEETDVFRRLGMPPYPPSRDRMMYVRAWKRRAPCGPRDRAAELMHAVHRALDPEQSQESDDPVEILAGGHAWCMGYCLVLGEALRREGFPVRWVTMLAEDHPRGVGSERRDTHELVEVRVPTGEWVALDPTAGVAFETSVDELVRDPTQADLPRHRDARYQQRHYDLYATSEWYRRVKQVAIRDRPDQRLRLRPVRRAA